MIGGAIGILKTAFDLFNWARKKMFPKTPSRTPKSPTTSPSASSVAGSKEVVILDYIGEMLIHFPEDN